MQGYSQLADQVFNAHDIFEAYPNMDGALTFIDICVDSSQTVLEHCKATLFADALAFARGRRIPDKPPNVMPRPCLCSVS